MSDPGPSLDLTGSVSRVGASIPKHLGDHRNKQGRSPRPLELWGWAVAPLAPALAAPEGPSSLANGEALATVHSTLARA